MLNATHDPGLTSWVASAQDPGTDFPIQNLPHGVFRRRGSSEPFRGGVAIGDQILDMRMAASVAAFSHQAQIAVQAAAEPSLNALMGMGPGAWRPLRRDLSRLLSAGAPEADRLAQCLVPQSDAEYVVPARIGDFTDFFTSWNHMINAGRVFQPDAPPLRNFRWLPIAYHGRASTVAISGTPVVRPAGQTMRPLGSEPAFGPTERLDFELELGVWVGKPNQRGEPIPIDDAEDHVFGLCILNDWSARDVQAWEALPLGPFLAKNFLTSISPWIVTLEALAPYRCRLPRTEEDPSTLPYLTAAGSLDQQGIDVELQVDLIANEQRNVISRTSFRHAYWSLAQMVTHHTEGGCALRAGDLFGTGTQSGPGPGEQGCMLELARGGSSPLTLADGQSRTYLNDGDTIAMRAWCERPGARRIGFGSCSGTVLPTLRAAIG